MRTHHIAALIALFAGLLLLGGIASAHPGPIAPDCGHRGPGGYHYHMDRPECRVKTPPKPAPFRFKELNGTWANMNTVVFIDFSANVYATLIKNKRVVMDLRFIDEYDNTVIFSVDGVRHTATIINGRDISVRKPEGPPMDLIKMD